MDIRKLSSVCKGIRGRLLSKNEILDLQTDTMYSALISAGKDIATLSYAMYRGNKTLVRAILRENPILNKTEWSYVYHDSAYKQYQSELKRHLGDAPEENCRVS